MNLLQFSIIIYTVVFFFCCGAPAKVVTQTEKEKPVIIANDSLAYEITIIDQGFNLYLNNTAKPVGFYSQNYLENKNLVFVSSWNLRVNNPFNYNPNIYENIIDYNSHVNYGYEVNYKLFNYFQFAQQKYRMRLR